MKAFGSFTRLVWGALFALATTSTVDAAPVAYWTFDFTNLDTVGPNHGTLNGAAAYSVDAAPASGSFGSLDLNGTAGTYFGVPTQALPTPGLQGTVMHSYTVSAWAKVRSTTGAHNIFNTRKTGAEMSFDMKLQNGNQVHGDIGNGVAWGNTAADAAFTYNANQWYHVAYTVTPWRWNVYVDGIQRGTGTYANNLFLTPLLWDQARQIDVGRYGGGAGSEFLNGLVDDVSVFSFPLAASQIASLAAGNSPLGIAPNRQGALRYIPITNDADSQISTSKTYTHTIDFGQSGPATVNGVTFNAQTASGAFPGGNGTTNIPNAHPGNVPAVYAGMGGVGALFQDMLYGSPEGVITLTGLTPGQSYDTRLYLRNWGAPNAANRPSQFEFDTNNDGLAERVIRINEDNASEAVPGFANVNQAYALSYTFIADSPTMTIRPNKLVTAGDTFHLYGLTNELTNRVPIESLWSTGLGDGGGRLLTGQVDPHWVLTSAPTGVVGAQALGVRNHDAWSLNNPGSTFISITDPGTSTILGGLYSYTTTFDMTGLRTDVAEIVMSIWADNAVTDIKLNGVSTGLSLIHPAATAFNDAGGKTFTLTTGFGAGLNTLEFVLRNDGDGPGALRVDLSGTSVVIPEPSTWAMAAIGALVLGLRRRRG